MRKTKAQILFFFREMHRLLFSCTDTRVMIPLGTDTVSFNTKALTKNGTHLALSKVPLNIANSY